MDYTEIFSSVVKHSSIQILPTMVAHFDMELEQMDVKTTFFYGEIEKTIYMRQPNGFEIKSKGDKICLLNKSLYGLKQSPRQWCFERSQFNSCDYFKKKSGASNVYILLYVDDMLLASCDKATIDDMKKQLRRRFEMKDLGPT